MGRSTQGLLANPVELIKIPEHYVLRGMTIMSELSISAGIASAMESGDSTPLSASERRRGPDRRKQEVPVAVERRTGRDRRDEADRRAAAGESERRRMVDPTTCERDYGTDETEFMVAMDTYKRANRRPFPTWSEVLEVLTALGYRKVADPVPLPGLPVAKKNNDS